MIVSALQMQPASCNKEKNLEQISQAARSASATGANLLVTPEMSVTGYAIWNDIRRMAEPRDGFISAALQKMARELNLAITAGMPELDGGEIYNTAICALPSGDIHFYRKCHLFGADERAAFRQGAQPSEIFEIGGVKAGLLICYDVEFPEWTRTLALAGAELIIVPTALPKSAANERVSRLMIPTRALENQCTIIYAGLCGSENALEYQGGTCIAGPGGEDLARAGAGPALITATIEGQETSGGSGDPYLNDRRPELYHRLMNIN